MPLMLLVFSPLASVLAQEAPVSYDQITNGYLTQQDFDSAAAIFNRDEVIQSGLGPVFNDSACGRCHHGPALGGDSLVRVIRAGFFDGHVFSEPPGGSMIPSRATNQKIKAQVPAGANVQTFRASMSTLGDGYVEAVLDNDLVALSAWQKGVSGGKIQGRVNWVPVLEMSGAMAVGRFGWKAQHASLVSFAADAFRNEIGITTPLIPAELTSNGRAVDAYEPAGLFANLPNRSDSGDVMKVATFTRSTQARPRIPGAPPLGAVQGPAPKGKAGQIKSGENTFNSIGCGICHTASLTTAAAGMTVNGGAYVVPPALASMTFHPFGDYLLHDIGTGDGIVQNGGQETRTMIRTAPLWGLSKRQSFMHDGQTTSIVDAIGRHGGEASDVAAQYQKLSAGDQQNLLLFLQSL